MEVPSESIESASSSTKKISIQTDNGTLPISSKKSTEKQKSWALISPNFMGADSPAALQPTPFSTNRFSLLIGYFIYSALTASVYFGWPGFSNMLFDSGAYAWNCNNMEKVTGARYLCESQDSAVQRLFQIALPSHFLTSAVAGTLIDTIGPKYTACIGQILNFISWILLSFASSSFNVYILAFVLMGAGADTGFLPVLHVSNLFVGHSGFIVALMGAAASSSFAVPTILDIIHSGGSISFQHICWGYSVVIVMALIYAAFLFPKNVFQAEESLNVASLNQEDSKNEPESFTGGWRTSVKSAVQQISASKKEFFTIKYLAILLFFSFTSLVFNFWMVSGEHLLGKSANNFFGLINPISFAPTIVYGKMADVFGIGLVMAINTGIGIVSYLSGILSYEFCKYISAIAMVIYVSFFTSQMFCFVKDAFDPAHFGKLVGVCSAFGGVFSSISIVLYDPLTKVTLSGNFLWISAVMIILLLLNFILVFVMHKSLKSPQLFVGKNLFPAQLSMNTAFSVDMDKNEPGDGFAVSMSTESITP
ncbi:transporter, major facilitator family protein [Cardiosporidium cionae]|uniref:Transporter, major facilitator family protein n=1 Tax=Cardiosporidium cionae TaxID=476202 RepID=A0ABQ7J4U9_9APIC|nr:transporter, major facilitator family protein [Cardiosporidium cionae]|eukprot:KAF8819009.1 transporter, major facilitator family protein [Cardiosporidium cionae]